MLDKSVPSLSGDDLVTSTNGMNDEYFDHQAGTINYVWDVQDNLTLKYNRTRQAFITKELIEIISGAESV